MNTTTHCTSADTDFELVRERIYECETVEQVNAILSRIDRFYDDHENDYLHAKLLKDYLIKLTQLTND